MSYDFEVEFKNKNTLEFIVSSREMYEATITIEKKDNKYFMHSNSLGRVASYLKPHLYEAEFFLFTELAETNPSFLKDVFDEERKNKLIKKIAKDFGLEKSKNYSKYFEVELDIVNTHFVKIKKEYNGLIPVRESKRKEQFNTFLTALTKKK